MQQTIQTTNVFCVFNNDSLNASLLVPTLFFAVRCPGKMPEKAVLLPLDMSVKVYL
jgi:hypothetical protein